MSKKRRLINHTLRQPRTCFRIGCLANYRALCFKLRRQMVLSNVLWAVLTLFIGIFFIIPVMLSMILFYNVLTSPSDTPSITIMSFRFENSLAAAVSPLVSSFSFYFFLTTLSWISHFHDMLHQGLFVWNRDILGFHLQHFTWQLCTMIALIRTRNLMSTQAPDNYQNELNRIFIPIYWALGLYLVKVCLIRSPYDGLKIAAALLILSLCMMTEQLLLSRTGWWTHPILVICVVNCLIVLQAVFDFKICHDSASVSKSIFYSYTNRSKRFAVTCNLVVSITVSSVLFFGMAYLIDQVSNHHQDLGS